MNTWTWVLIVCILAGLGLGVYAALCPLSLDLWYCIQAAVVLALLVGSIVRDRQGRPNAGNRLVGGEE